VFVYTPSEKRGKAYKFACPFVGPYRVLELYDNGVKLKRIDKPKAQQIRVALNRVRLCPAEIRGTSAEGNETVEQTEVDSCAADVPVAEGKVVEAAELDLSMEDNMEMEDECPAPDVSVTSKDNSESQGKTPIPSKSDDKKDPTRKNVWFRRLRPRRNKKNVDHRGR